MFGVDAVELRELLVVEVVEVLDVLDVLCELGEVEVVETLVGLVVVLGLRAPTRMTATAIIRMMITTRIAMPTAALSLIPEPRSTAGTRLSFMIAPT